MSAGSFTNFNSFLKETMKSKLLRACNCNCKIYP
jgi:hypothetical protein